MEGKVTTTQTKISGPCDFRGLLGFYAEYKTLNKTVTFPFFKQLCELKILEVPLNSGSERWIS